MTFRNLLVAMSMFAIAIPAQAADSLSLSKAWVRALPPTQSVTAAYVEARNTGDTPLVITGASVAGAGRVEIHRTVIESGLASMQHLSTLTVKAGETAALAPGGTHLMVFELDAMPRPGETRRLCLQLESGAQACTDAEVRKSAPEAGHSHHH